MGFLDSVGVKDSFLGNINWAGLGSWAAIIFILIAVVIVVGIGVFLYYSKKLKKAHFKNEIPLFANINGKHSRVGIDQAKEVFIPDSNISLFFLKNKKIYIARPTRAMGKNEYWYSISENGEWINFDLSTDPGEDTLAKANYDHRDTRYAYVNLKDIIKRNYKDKAIQWWKEYSHLITFIIVSFIFVGSCWLLLSRIGKLIGQLGPFVDQMKIIAEIMGNSVQTAQSINSGVITG